MMSPEQWLDQLLKIASMNEKNIPMLAGDMSRRGFLPLNYRSYIRSVSSYCLRTTKDFGSYAEALRKFTAIEKFEELLSFHQSQEFPSVFASYSGDDVDIVAVPIALGRFDLAIPYISNVLAPAKSNPLWSGYVKGLTAIREPIEIELKISKPKSMEKHWVLYIQLMASLSIKEASATIEQEINQSFSRCNGDKRLVEITHIDPSGNFPVAWDLRRSYLQELAAYET